MTDLLLGLFVFVPFQVLEEAANADQEKRHADREEHNQHSGKHGSSDNPATHIGALFG
jgi:hypothetical protein